MHDEQWMMNKDRWSLNFNDEQWKKNKINEQWTMNNQQGSMIHERLTMNNK
jgi:hypothetical protein